MFWRNELFGGMFSGVMSGGGLCYGRMSLGGMIPCPIVQSRVAFVSLILENYKLDASSQFILCNTRCFATVGALKGYAL